MQKAPVLKSSGLAPIDDEPVHVFGRNLESRVVESKEDDSNNKREAEVDSKREQEDDVETIKRRKFETITGEEDEETVFQGDFKLFIWDKSTSNWIEKGRGQLKLNDSIDSNEHKSRLIMRAGGTYRIILNVAIQHSFFKVIANTKTNIRFTDSQNVWAASGSNAIHLGELIGERLELAAEKAKKADHFVCKTGETEESGKAEESTQAADNSESGEVKLEQGQSRANSDERAVKTEENPAQADGGSADLTGKDEELEPNGEAGEKLSECGSKSSVSDESTTDSGDGPKPVSEPKLVVAQAELSGQPEQPKQNGPDAHEAKELKEVKGEERGSEDDRHQDDAETKRIKLNLN